MTRRFEAWRSWAPPLAAALLLAATAAAYLPVAGHSFVNWDDNFYVTDNPQVKAGLTREGFAWAFTSLGYASNWHPLAWLSHMLDAHLYGLAAGGHHVTSLLLHLANTLLLLLFLRRATGAQGPSAFVAALFALHPLHVESVAWVAERKDVLAAFFWLLTMIAWLGWLRRRGPGRYLLATSLFLPALLSKPMAVTLPCVLLLLDWWPLGRLLPRDGPARFTAVARLVAEKIPLLLLAAASSVLTWMAQQRGGAIAGSILPVGQRAANALVAYGVYVVKTLWPAGLAPYYPYPAHSWSRLILWQAAAAGLALLIVSAAALITARRAPYLVVGWLWYLGTLLPVIGLVQIGMQARADRYTYLPLVGIFLFAGFGVAALTRDRPGPRAIAGIAGVLIVSSLAAATHAQVAVWRDSFTLFEQVLRVQGDDATAPGLSQMHLSQGSTLKANGKLAEALEHFLLAVRGHPGSWEAHYLLGDTYAALGRPREAELEYRETVRINPAAAGAWNNLGALLYAAGRMGEAEAAYTEAVRRTPTFSGARFNLGLILVRERRFEEALAQYREVLRLEPANPSARREVERLLLLRGDRAGAP